MAPNEDSSNTGSTKPIAFISNYGGGYLKISMKDIPEFASFMADAHFMDVLCSELAGKDPMEENTVLMAAMVEGMTLRYGPENITRLWRKILWLQNLKEGKEKHIFPCDPPKVISGEEVKAIMDTRDDWFPMVMVAES
jgi:hypothetical protein